MLDSHLNINQQIAHNQAHLLASAQSSTQKREFRYLPQQNCHAIDQKTDGTFYATLKNGTKVYDRRSSQQTSGAPLSGKFKNLDLENKENLGLNSNAGFVGDRQKRARENSSVQGIQGKGSNGPSPINFNQPRSQAQHTQNQPLHQTPIFPNQLPEITQNSDINNSFSYTEEAIGSFLNFKPRKKISKRSDSQLFFDNENNAGFEAWSVFDRDQPFDFEAGENQFKVDSGEKILGQNMGQKVQVNGEKLRESERAPKIARQKSLFDSPSDSSGERLMNDLQPVNHALQLPVHASSAMPQFNNHVNNYMGSVPVPNRPNPYQPAQNKNSLNPEIQNRFNSLQKLIADYTSAIIYQKTDILDQIHIRKNAFFKEMELKFEQMLCDVQSTAAKQLGQAYEINEIFNRQILYEQKYTIENFNLIAGKLEDLSDVGGLGLCYKLGGLDDGGGVCGHLHTGVVRNLGSVSSTGGFVSKELAPRTVR